MYEFEHTSTNPHHSSNHHSNQRNNAHSGLDHFQSFQLSSAKGGKGHSKNDSDEGLGGIHCRTDLHVVTERVEKELPDVAREGSSRSSGEAPHSVFGDETPLRKNSANVKVTELAV